MPKIGLPRSGVTPRRGTFQHHLRSVPGRPSSGTPTVCTWVPSSPWIPWGPTIGDSQPCRGTVARPTGRMTMGHVNREDKKIREFVSRDIARRRWTSGPRPRRPGIREGTERKKEREREGREKNGRSCGELRLLVSSREPRGFVPSLPFLVTVHKFDRSSEQECGN